MANPPPQTAIILKGWAHLTRCMSQTLPTQLHKTHRIRRSALNGLRRGRS